MSYSEFQKIILHTTSNLAKDQEIIDYEKDAIQRIMMDNQIKFSIEIEEISNMSRSLKHTGIAYSLNLIVGKYDLDKVIELLDKEGGFGYYIDLDEKYDPNESSEDEDVAFVDIPEELKEDEEEINEEPIKTYGDKDGNISAEFNAAEFEGLVYLILRLFIIFSGGIIMFFELIMLIQGIKELEYELATTAFVMMVVEIPMLIYFYKLLKKKKK